MIGIAFHSPLDVSTMMPEWVPSEDILMVPYKLFRSDCTKTQVVFGSERDLRKVGIEIADMNNGVPCDLTTSIIDKLFAPAPISK